MADILPNLEQERMMRDLVASGVPALVYCAPVAPDLAEFPAAAAAHAEVLKALADLRAAYESPHLRIVVEIPQQITDELSFRDLLHLEATGTGRLPDYLATELAALLEVS